MENGDKIRFVSADIYFQLYPGPDIYLQKKLSILHI
jgi:hypothetical protein